MVTVVDDIFMINLVALGEWIKEIVSQFIYGVVVTQGIIFECKQRVRFGASPYLLASSRLS